jgi:release factor glutamine methyltransferase
MSNSIAQSILAAARHLHSSGVPEARREAALLLTHVIGRDRTFIISHPEHLITAAQLESFDEYVERRAKGEPLQYITGYQDFFGLDFEVTKDVLIPRPETELLVETALELIGGPGAAPLICDVGTGSGCIVITLLHEVPLSRAVAIDVSAAAIRVAERNAIRHAVEERIAFVIADCFAGIDVGPKFDLVVSNPPYVARHALEGLQREVRDYEPRVALIAGDDGLSMIRRLLSEGGCFLKAGGYLLIEIGFDQGAALEKIIDRNTWNLPDIRQDLQRIPRTVALQKIAS